MNPTDLILSYHEQTKHHMHRFAAGPGFMDWASQPAPFRTYEGATRFPLPLAADSVSVGFPDLHVPGAVPPRPMDLSSIGLVFELAMGLSAWKEYQGTRWALRCNPSSGNLHPTEGYVITAGLEGLPAGVYHYVSRDHCLERRAVVHGDEQARLAELLPAGTALVGLSSIHWREAWKYGERAFRYCQHDVGHAIAAVRYAAAVAGWSVRLIDDLGDDRLASLMGIGPEHSSESLHELDREHPDTAILLDTSPADIDDRVADLRGRADELVKVMGQKASWHGLPNSLSEGHAHWDLIEDAAVASARPSSAESPVALASSESSRPFPRGSAPAAATLIRQRRSCLGLDGETAMAVDRFYHMLDRLLPRSGVPPWDAVPWAPHLHCVIFVHRVTGLEPGLYFLERSEAVHGRLLEACGSQLAWEEAVGCPEHLRLFLLSRSDLRTTAQAVSCHQEIAADGAFSLGMIADFETTIRQHGAWWWRRLFWESGVLGQVLYLEAEAAGLRSTGIGCFFDDAVHNLLGLKTDTFQSLYHFTVGAPIEDTRLRTLPPYGHLPSKVAEPKQK